MLFIPPFGSPPGASKTLDNLASVSINTSLISDTDSTDNLGSSNKFWANLYADRIYVNPTAFIDGAVAGEAQWSAHLKPKSGGAYDLGDSTLTWRDIYLSRDIWMNSAGAFYPGNDADIFISGGSNDLNIYNFAVGNIYIGGANPVIIDDSDLIPLTDSGYDLGSSTKYWAEIYTDKIFLNATATLDGTVAGVINGTGNWDINGYYMDLDEIAAPSNPSAGTRRLFVNSATNEISVRTSAGATVSLEAVGIGGGLGLTTKGDLHTYDTDDVRLGVGADGEVLIADSAQALGLKWASPAGGGQTLYDAVVAPSGGDYTSIVTACATEAAGATIFVRAGTYTETADVVLKNKQRLIGERREETIIDFDNASYQVYGLNLVNGVTLENLTIKDSADPNGTVYLNGCHYTTIKNCKVIQGTTNTHGIYYFGNYSVVKDCIVSGFTGSSKYSIYAQDYCRVYGNYIPSSRRAIRVGYYGVVVGNFVFFWDNGVRPYFYSVIVGNYFASTNDNGVYCTAEGIVITGNIFSSSRIYVANTDMIVISGNRFSGHDALFIGSGSTDVVFSGNLLGDTTINTVLGSNHSITGNVFKGNSSLTLGASKSVVTGNNFGASSTVPPLNDTGIGNIVKNNIGLDSLTEKEACKMKNTSGGSLAAGDLVVLKAVAAGNEVTTTTTQGDDLVFGVAVETISDNAYGYIQTLGKTTVLKVDGTTDIAIGDFIGAFTTAKIGMKVAAGDMAIAIALEAYTTDDSSGVIDALLITPRKI